MSIIGSKASSVPGIIIKHDHLASALTNNALELPIPIAVSPSSRTTRRTIRTFHRSPPHQVRETSSSQPDNQGPSSHAKHPTRLSQTTSARHLQYRPVPPAVFSLPLRNARVVRRLPIPEGVSIAIDACVPPLAARDIPFCWGGCDAWCGGRGEGTDGAEVELVWEFEVWVVQVELWGQLGIKL
jgi:hypothetical protein